MKIAGNSILVSDEKSRKAAAIRTLSLGLIAAAAVGVILAIIFWLIDPSNPLVPAIIAALAVMLISSSAYRLAKAGRVRIAGYIFVFGFLVVAAIITPLLGGFIGPVAIVYLFPILAAGMVLGIGYSFLLATFAVVLYLVMIPVEQSGLLPQLVVPEDKAAVISYMTVGLRIIFFYLVAFLSWFAANRLQQALQDTRSYAAELQTANEKLHASEEELKAANEELRATEEELRASNEELAAANEELREAQDQLIRSERLAAIGQLAGGVGHELRNPLGAIKNAIYYIKGRLVKSDFAEKEPRVMEFLNIVDGEVGASDKIINDLLGFSRVSKPAVTPTPVRGLVDGVLSKVTIPENIELNVNIGSDSTEIAVDAEQIQQVLTNVVTNAVQAMPEGGKLTISTRERNGFLELAVTDTGSGIAEENKGKIFEPLFTTRAKGIGLGLAVSKSIIDRHGGQIEARSAIGKGTTFTIRLPLEATVQEGIVGKK